MPVRSFDTLPYIHCSNLPADRQVWQQNNRNLIMAKPIWTIFGLFALALGAIGVVLPLLPTTPFVLLASFAFAKASPRLQKMLQDHQVFGPILADWRAHGAIATRYKCLALGMMAATFGISLVWGLPSHILIIQAVCMLGAAAFILSRPSGAGE